MSPAGLPWDDPNAEPLADMQYHIEAARRAPSLLVSISEHATVPDALRRLLVLGGGFTLDQAERITRDLSASTFRGFGTSREPETWVHHTAGPHVDHLHVEVRPRESHFDAVDRLTAQVDTGYRYNPNDQAAFDVAPDDCWRCCAVEAENDLGTCNACRDDLRG